MTCDRLGAGTLLDRCTFRLAPGVRLVIVAEPDASGTTLLRILAGLARPSRGRAEVAGVPAATDRGTAARVAYVGPSPSLASWMTPRDAMHAATRLLDLGRSTSARRIREALAWVELPSSTLDRPLRHAGPAVAQRADLATALVGAPEVLLLDEPLRAVPPDERRRLLRLPGRRLTMLLASRYPRSEAGIASHVMLLRGGRVELLATIAQLEASGYPLSREGIAGFAGRHTAAPPSPVVPPVRAPVPR